MWLVHQSPTARDVTGVLAQQQADVVFGLRDRLLQADDFSLGLLHQHLRLIHIGDGRVAALVLDGVQLQDIVVGRDRFLRVDELRVVLAKQEIILATSEMSVVWTRSWP